jgi:uncharacterized protein YqjF (DUF2071 family)
MLAAGRVMKSDGGSGHPGMADRLKMRLRPRGSPLMYQTWDSLLFMHWRVPEEVLKPLIPARLSIDKFYGSAWLTVTPFTLSNVRPIYTPPLPWVSDFHEINVRTYVHFDGDPGVWFFSLDANSTLPVLAARAVYHLPYHDAEIRFENNNGRVDFAMDRSSGQPSAHFDARWSIGNGLSESVPGSLEFFLTERYCLYAEHKGELYRARINHRPWPLQAAALDRYQTDLFQANSLPVPDEDPTVCSGGPVKVEVWPLEKVT